MATKTRKKKAKATKQKPLGWMDVDAPPEVGTIFVFEPGQKFNRRNLPCRIVFRNMLETNVLALEEIDGSPWPDDETNLAVEYWNMTFAGLVLRLENAGAKKTRKKKKVKVAKEKPLGWIDPADLPATGTVFVLEVPDGVENPTGQTTADIAGAPDIPDRFELEFESLEVAGPAGEEQLHKPCTIVHWRDRRDGRSDWRSLREWNSKFAPLVEEIAFDVQIPADEPDAEPSTEVSPPAARPEGAKIVMLRVADIGVVSGRNARLDFDALGIGRLSASLGEHGMLQAIVVAKHGKNLELVAGERRLRAAKLAGEEFIEAKVYPSLTERQAAGMALAENFDRAPLNHIEMARALGRDREVGVPINSIASIVHRSADYVREHLDLLRLTDAVQQLVASGRLPIRQAGIIARVGDPAKQIELAEWATRLEWRADVSDGHWCAERAGGLRRGKYNPDAPQSTKDRDFVMSMDTLRERVARVMLGLAACGWIGEEQRTGVPFPGIDGRGLCVGCPDNSASYVEHPALFADVKPRGSAKKGHCTNETCYRAKETAWDKVRAKRKKEQEMKQAAKVRKAKAAGLDVCEDCGRTAQADETLDKRDGRKLCAKCLAKPETHGKADPPREFPREPAEYLAVALHRHGVALAKSIGGAIGTGSMGADGTDVPELILWAQTQGSHWGGNIPARRHRPKLDDVLGVLGSDTATADIGAGIGDTDLAAWWTAASQWAGRCKPQIIGYSGKVYEVPLPRAYMAHIDDLERIARSAGLVIPTRPTAETVARERAIKAIVKGPGPEARKAIAVAGRELIESIICVPAFASGIKGKIAKWRVGAMQERLEALKGNDVGLRIRKGETETEEQKATNDLRNIILHGKRANATVAIGACGDVQLLTDLFIVTGRLPKWKASAIEKRLVDLNQLRNRILQGRKADALAALVEADVAELEACEAIGLKGDWRRAAVAKRIKFLQAAETE